MEKLLNRWFIVFFTTILTVSFTSCDDDDNDEPIKHDDLSEQLIGKWIVEKSFAEDIEEGDIFYFLSSGLATWDGDNLSGKYTLEGKKLVINFVDDDGDIERLSGTISIDGNMMSYEFTWYWTYGDEYCYDNKMILRKMQ